jgi:hypothetical protein
MASQQTKPGRLDRAFLLKHRETRCLAADASGAWPVPSSDEVGKTHGEARPRRQCGLKNIYPADHDLFPHRPKKSISGIRTNLL